MKILGYTFQDIWNYTETSSRNLDSILKVKKFTSFCNSVSIKLIQMEALNKALEICSKGLEASLVLAQTNKALKLWPGRILAFCVKAYVLYKLERPMDSIKSLFESQLLLQTTKESVGPFCLELYILTNFLTYMCLWRINRKQESLKYLEIVKVNVSSIKKGKILTKFPRVSIDNLYGLVVYSLSLMKIGLEGNYKEAKSVSEEVLNELGEEVMSRSLINSVLMNIKRIEKNPYGIVELELGQEFEDILFISIFLPMISPNIPNIRAAGSNKNLVKRKATPFSKRSSSGSSAAGELYQLRGNNFQHSPNSRPRSGFRAESPSLTMTRPRTSNGTYLQKRINQIYLP